MSNTGSSPTPPPSRPQCRGYSAYITCGGVELTAYGTYVDEYTRTVTCYVQSEAGKVGSLV